LGVCLGVVVGMVGAMNVDINHGVAGFIAKADSQQVEIVNVEFDKFAFGEWIFTICPPVWFESVIGGDEVKAEVKEVNQLGKKGWEYHCF
jgi:hypothetical protein